MVILQLVAEFWLGLGIAAVCFALSAWCFSSYGRWRQQVDQELRRREAERLRQGGKPPREDYDHAPWEDFDDADWSDEDADEG